MKTIIYIYIYNHDSTRNTAPALPDFFGFCGMHSCRSLQICWGLWTVLRFPSTKITGLTHFPIWKVGFPKLMCIKYRPFRVPHHISFYLSPDHSNHRAFAFFCNCIYISHLQQRHYTFLAAIAWLFTTINTFILL